nr:nitroreductase family protein [Saprospiraceae bacterium]
HQVGLVTLTHTPSPMNFLHEILGRPENERAYLLLPVGHPSDDAEVPILEKKTSDQVIKYFE